MDDPGYPVGTTRFNRQLTDWVPATVMVGNCGRRFLATDDGQFLIEAKRDHPLLENGMLVEITMLEGSMLAVRKLAQCSIAALVPAG